MPPFAIAVIEVFRQVRSVSGKSIVRKYNLICGAAGRQPSSSFVVDIEHDDTI